MAGEKAVRPDVAAKDAKVSVLQKELKSIDRELAELQDKLKSGGKRYVSGVSAEKSELEKRLADAIVRQDKLKEERVRLHGAVKDVELDIKRKNGEIGVKLNHKNVKESAEELKAKIDDIDKTLKSGELSLLNERKLILEKQNIANLRKLVLSVAPLQKSIAADRVKIEKLKKQLSQLNPREVAGVIDDLTKQLQRLQSGTKSTADQKKNDEFKRTLLFKRRDLVYNEMRSITTKFNKELRTYRRLYAQEILEIEVKEELAKLRTEKEKTKSDLEKALADAKVPAFADEILEYESCLLALDPDFCLPQTHYFKNISTGRETILPVEANGLETIEKKEGDEYLNTAPSKSKKILKLQKNDSNDSFQKKHVNNGKFSLEPSLITTLARLDVLIPISSDQVETSVKQLKQKLHSYQSRQEGVTEKNIKKAEDKIKSFEESFQKREEAIQNKLKQSINIQKREVS